MTALFAIAGRFCRPIFALLLLAMAGMDPTLAQQRGPTASDAAIELTAQERAWLAANHVVRARVADYPPYMFQHPQPNGISVDYLAAAAKRFGFKVEFLPDTTGFPAAVADVGGPRRNYDLLLTFTRSPERATRFAITADYLTAPWVVYARQDSPYIVGLESLGGKTVAGEKGFVITSKIKQDYPTIRLLEVEKSADALIAVATGQADAYVGNLANASYLIKNLRLDNLVVAAPTTYGINTQAMAVRNDWPELAGLINKSIAAMSVDERNAINQRWGVIEIRPRIDYTLVWQTILVFSLVVLAILYWNRKRAHEIIRLSEARLNRAELASRTGHWELHLKTRTIVASLGAARLYGLTNGKFDLATIQGMALPEDRPCLDASLGNLLEHDKPYDVEYRIRTADTGELKHIHSQATIDRDKQILFGILQDITERKRAEQVQLESELFIRSAIDAVLEHICVLDHGGNILMVNRAWRDFYEQNHADPTQDRHGIGRNYLQLCDSACGPFAVDARLMAKGIRDVIEGRAEIFTLEYPCNSPTEERWFIARVSPFHGISGNVLVSHENITEQKRHEAELERHRRHLEDLVRERTAALSIAKEAAEAANRAKTMFLATMSHELRTPMNAIMGLTELIRRRSTDPKLLDQTGKILGASNQLLTIINDILNLSRIEADSPGPERVEFKLATVLKHLDDLFKPEAMRKRLSLEMDVDPALASRSLLGDPLRLGQVLFKLLSNAIKFTAAGKVTVRVVTREETAEIVLLRFEIQDTGIGILPEDQKRLFSPFEQLDGSMTREQGGTGIGLAISKRLVQAMDGEIGMESQAGAGSTFWFVLKLGKA